jgi:hypothetical protein
MAVEAGLADQELQPFAEPARGGIDRGAHVVEAGGVVAHGAPDAGRRAVFAEDFPQGRAPLAGGDPRLGAGDRGRHDIRAVGGGAAQGVERFFHGDIVARRAPGLQPRNLLGLDLVRHGEDRLVAGGKRRGLRLNEAIDADDGLLAALDRLQPLGVGIDEPLLHVARLDRLHRAAHLFDLVELVPRLRLELADFARNFRRAVEQIAVFEQIGLEGDDLLHADRPLLVPRPRETQRLVPGGELHRAGACGL